MSSPAGDSHSFEWGFNDLWSHSEQARIRMTLANGRGCELMLSAKALTNTMRFCYSNIVVSEWASPREISILLNGGLTIVVSFWASPHLEWHWQMAKVRTNAIGACLLFWRLWSHRVSMWSLDTNREAACSRLCTRGKWGWCAAYLPWNTLPFLLAKSAI